MVGSKIKVWWPDDKAYVLILTLHVLLTLSTNSYGLSLPYVYLIFRACEFPYSISGGSFLPVPNFRKKKQPTLNGTEGLFSFKSLFTFAVKYFLVCSLMIFY